MASVSFPSRIPHGVPSSCASAYVPVLTSLPESQASTTKTEEVPKAEGSTVPSFDSTIEREVFDQLLEMDDEDDRTFSQEIVWNFFEQATSTFAEMDTAL